MVKSDYESWCEQVFAILQSRNRVRGRYDNEPVAIFFDRCRGDEPRMSYDAGETATEYAKFIMEPGGLDHELPDGTPCNDDGDTGYMEAVEL